MIIEPRMPPKRSEYIAAMLGWIVGLHFVGASVFFLIFSYQYAHENSFGAWLFFGEFVPAGKALAWEYFALKPNTESAAWTDEEVSNVQHFWKAKESLETCLKVIDEAYKSG